MHAPTGRWRAWSAGYLRWSYDIVAWTAGAALAVAVGVNAWNVTLRYGWSAGTIWHQEVALLAAFCIYFLAYGLIAKREAYIQIEFFVDLLPAWARRVVVLVNRLLVIGFHAAMFVFCIAAIELVWNEVTWILELPEALFFVPLTVASVDIVITEIILLERAIRGEAKAPAVGTADA